MFDHLIFRNSAQRKGWSCVAGGFLIHLVLGTLYCWANITSAVTSYIRIYDPSVTYGQTLGVYTCQLALQGCFMFLGGFIGHRIGTRNITFIGGTILSIGIFLASTAKSLPFLLLTNGCMFGIGIGLCYTSPLSCAVKWLPKRKGLVTGIIISGFGSGAFVFGNIAISYVNPHRDGVEEDGFYSKDSDIVKRVPTMYLLLGSLYFVCISLGSYLITDPTVEDERILHSELGNSSIDNSSYSSDTPVLVKTKSSGITSSGSSTIVANSRSKNSNKSSSQIDKTRYQNAPQDEDDEEVEGIEIVVFNTGRSGRIESHLHHNIDSKAEDEPRSRSSTGGSSDFTIDRNQAYKMDCCRHSDDWVDRPDPTELGPSEVLKSTLGWHIALCFIMTTVGGMYISGTFKVFGQTAIHDESYLSFIASTASLFNTAGRVTWGSLADRFGALRTLTYSNFLFALIIGTYPFALTQGEAAFALWTFAIFFFEGANFVLYVPIIVQAFGKTHSGANYGMIFTSFSAFAVLNLLVLADLGIPFLNAAIAMSVLTFLGYANLLLLDRHVSSVLIENSSVK